MNNIFRANYELVSSTGTLSMPRTGKNIQKIIKGF